MPAEDPAVRADEFSELLGLLLEYRRDDSLETRAVAKAMVAACAGDNHLWEDMRLPERGALSELIRHHFPLLYYRNTKNMRWKKFFYKQLCDRAEVKMCKSPSCGACTDYKVCFGPE